MEILVRIAGRTYRAESSAPIDISIPLRFDGRQPGTYGVPRASARAYEDGRFVGDTRRGGSCNFEEYRLVPHCNGTHTECVGHIAHERIAIHTTLQTSLMPATLVTVTPAETSATGESYRPDKKPEDHLITAKDLHHALRESPPEFLEALVIRTLPNDEGKKSRDYRLVQPPFFSLEAMEYLVSLNIRHLLVDTPSVDRLLDEGLLSVHRIFWAVPQGSFDIDPENHSPKTITEMIFVPDEIRDGPYLLELQIPPFVADAAPSRPVLYPISGPL